MLAKFVMTPTGLALDRFLVRHLGFSLTIPVTARANHYPANPALYLETVGRKSGQLRGVALPYFTLGGRRLLVASKGGAPTDPAWALNLRANPDAAVYIKRRRYPIRARFLEGAERDETYDTLKREITSYAHYETLTNRKIPVIVLENR